MKEMISKLINREDLSTEEMTSVICRVMEGEATPAQIGSFLTALRVKGETVEEIYGAVLGMRKKAVRICHKRQGLLDTCGTGGDGKNTFNISTAVAFVAVAAGIPVAKHGNRAVSSACGSADVLEALGVKVTLKPEQVERCIERVGVGFLFAPLFHSAMKYTVGPRRELGFRTIFNILGPLTNPAKTDYQLLGVFDRELLPVFAKVLAKLGVKRALIVHGADGIDELSLSGVNHVFEVREGRVYDFYTLTPEEVGIPRAPLAALRGGSAKENAVLIRRILSGEKGPQRNVVLLNSGAALYTSGQVESIAVGAKKAAEVIDSGRALAHLEELATLSNRLGEESVCI